jgi:hypothetical protein
MGNLEASNGRVNARRSDRSPKSETRLREVWGQGYGLSAWAISYTEGRGVPFPPFAPG